MIVETRKTAAGTEYWDNKAKKVLFVPKGKEPNFEVTTNPKSMVGGVDLANGKDTTVETTIEVNGKVISQTSIDLNEMTIKELKQYAADNLIDIPSDITRKEDIVTYLTTDTE